MPRLLVLGLIGVLAAGSAQAAPGFSSTFLRAGDDAVPSRDADESSFLSSVAQIFGMGETSKSAVSTEETAKDSEGTVKEECDEEKPEKDAAAKDEQAKMAKQIGPEPIYLAF